MDINVQRNNKVYPEMECHSPSLILDCFYYAEDLTKLY